MHSFATALAIAGPHGSRGYSASAPKNADGLADALLPGMRILKALTVFGLLASILGGCVVEERRGPRHPYYHHHRDVVIIR